MKPSTTKKIKKAKFISTFLDCTKLKLGKTIPIKVGHLITYRCNLKCNFCYNKSQKGKDEMTTEQIKNMMDEFKKMGTKIWKIGGGEPLLRDDIEEIINYGKNLGFVVNVDTNGTLVKNNLYKLKNVDSVSLSLDGPEEIHDKIRGIKGVFKKVQESIQLLHKIGVRPHLSAVLTKDNIEHLDFLVNFTKENNCHIDFQPVVPINENAKKESSKNFTQAFDKIITLKKTNPHIANSTESLKRLKDYFSNKINKFQYKCLAGKMYCLISPNGNVSPCLFRLTEDWPSGLDSNFKTAFNNLPKNKDCDCIFNCYYNMSRLYSLEPKMLLKAFKNIIKDNWIYS